MEILSTTKKATQIRYLITMDWACESEHSSDFLLFDNENDAIKEYDAQLKKLKTGDTWEGDAFAKLAVDEHGNYNEDDESGYYYGEYDYTNSYKSQLQNAPNSCVIVKSFSIYADGYESEMHTYLTLFAVGTIC